VWKLVVNGSLRRELAADRVERAHHTVHLRISGIGDDEDAHLSERLQKASSTAFFCGHFAASLLRLDDRNCPRAQA
jgi:hypothetical protein